MVRQKRLLARFRNMIKVVTNAVTPASERRIIEEAADNIIVDRIFAHNNESINFDKNGLKKYLAFAERAGLSNAERLSIEEYTVKYYEAINKAMNAGEILTFENQVYEKTLNRALEKMPIFKGIVYRGVKLNESMQKMIEEYRKAHDNNTPVIHNSFTSSSRKQKEAEKFGEVAIFRIKSKNGRAIEELSKWGKNSLRAKENEFEVLFKSGTQFQVTGFEEIIEDGKVIYKIELKEL